MQRQAAAPTPFPAVAAAGPPLADTAPPAPPAPPACACARRAPSAWWQRCGCTTRGPHWPGARSTAAGCARPGAGWSSNCGCRRGAGSGEGLHPRNVCFDRSGPVDLENRVKDSRSASPLFFRTCRLQEFVELVRAERMLDAIAYARRHLAPWAATHLAQLQRCAALLAFTGATTCPRYRELLEEVRAKKEKMKPGVETGRGNLEGKMGGLPLAAQHECHVNCQSRGLRCSGPASCKRCSAHPFACASHPPPHHHHHTHTHTHSLQARWGELVQLFHRELYRLNLLPPMSQLSIYLQARRAALPGVRAMPACVRTARVPVS